MKFIPTRVHGAIDYSTGFFLLVSPWVLGFADQVYWPHLIIGLAELAVTLMSQPYVRKPENTCGGSYVQ